MSFVQAQPPQKVIERFNQQDVPPGLTRVTIVHGVDEQRTEIDHGAGKVPPPFQKQESFQCTNGGLDTCDTNSFNGKKWFDLPVNYYVNLEGSNDDGNFLEAVKAGSMVWEDGANSSFDQEFISETTLQASGPQKRQMDGVNVVDWGNTKKFGSNVIAVTLFWYFTSTGEIVEADFRYNQGFSWSSNGGPLVLTDPETDFGDLASMDVQNIAAHEFGHFHAALFDITDSSANKLTMYAFGSLGETKKRTLGVGDQNSIVTAYPPDITNTPPVADAGGSYSGTEDIPIQFDGSGSSDFDGDTLSYLWDFGDGNTSTLESPLYTYLSGDIFDVTLTVSDGRGGSHIDTTTADVTEVNDVPVSDPNGPYSGTVDKSITFDGSGSSDFDGDTLSYSWNFGDGSALGTGVSPTHTYNLIDEFTVTLTVSDGNGGSNSATTTADVSELGDSTVSVSSITYSTHGGRDGLKHLDITIALLDDLGDPVSGASVSITLEHMNTGDSWLGTGTTGSDGIVIFTLNNAPSGTYTTTVTEVTAAGLTWDRVTPSN